MRDKTAYIQERVRNLLRKRLFGNLNNALNAITGNQLGLIVQSDGTLYYCRAAKRLDIPPNTEAQDWFNYLVSTGHPVATAMAPVLVEYKLRK